MSARILLLLLVAIIALAMTAPSQAQVATPSAENLLTDLGLPEITITATDEGLELSQSKVPAGRYLVTLDNQSNDPDLSVEIARLLEHVRSAKTDCPSLFPPSCIPWYPQTYLPGGVSGQSPHAVLDLPAGKYGLWGPWPESVEPEARLTVTSDPDAVITGPDPEAEASIIVTKGEDGYGIALKIEGELKPGPQIVRIINAAKQPIFVAAAQEPESPEDDDGASRPVFDTASESVSPLDVFNSSEFGRLTFSVPQSPGAAQWVVIDLMPVPVYVAGYLPDPVSHEDVYTGWYVATAVIEPVADS